MVSLCENQKMSYEDCIKRLEEIVVLLEKGELSLEDSMKNYKEAMDLSSYCSKMLEKYKQQITIINEKGEAIEFSGE